MSWRYLSNVLRVTDSTIEAYVEAEEMHWTPSDDSTYVQYTMSGTDYKFSINAKYHDLMLILDNIDSPYAAKGSTIGLGQISDRKAYIVIGGEGGSLGFYTIGQVDKWMNMNLSKWQDRTLRQLCVPASHDSGMSVCTWSTLAASPWSIITQYCNVYQQLMLGVRYFDIRPVHHSGKWVSGHYTYVDQLSSWQGGDGQPIEDIINQINQFITDGHNELIVLSISHAQIINDRGGASTFEQGDFKDLDVGQWKELHDLLDGIRGRWDGSANDLTQVPLKNFIGPANGTNRSSVVLLFDDSVIINGRTGYFHNSAWPWDGSDWTKPEGDRLADFKNHASQANAKPYNYSGTHTQTTEEAVKTTLGASSNSVLNLSENPKNKLFTEMYPACTGTMYPCSLTLDAIDRSDLTALCLAITDRIGK